MAASPAETVEQHIANLQSLTLPEFTSLTRRTESEVQNISNHLKQLQVESSRLFESREALIHYDSYRRGREQWEKPEVLVPLTGALYAKGRLHCEDKVLVDIGAGYLLQKTCEAAKKDNERALGLLSEQQGKLEKLLSEKQKQHEVLITMRQKIVEQLTAEGPAAPQQQPGI